MSARISEVPKDRKVLLYCAVGLRGYLALQILKGHGYTQVYNLSGGYKHYLGATAPLPKQSQSACPEPKHLLHVLAFLLERYKK